MKKKLLITAVCALSLSACGKEKPVQPTVSAEPKQIIDKAQSDLDKANAIAAEKMKAAEEEAAK